MRTIWPHDGPCNMRCPKCTTMGAMHEAPREGRGCLIACVSGGCRVGFFYCTERMP